MLNYYKYHSNALQSSCIVCFEDGIFKSFEVENPTTTTTDASKIHVWKTEEVFLNEAKERKVVYTKIDREITFDMFYEKFGNKVGKVEAKRAWDKLTNAEKQQAYDYLATYLNHKKLTGTSMQYPASYLNSKRFVK